jgi:hypothetical protein
MERTFDELPFGTHLAAVDFVSLPIASLTLCVAVCCILTSAAILHRGCTSMAAEIACAHHVLRLDEYRTTEMSVLANILYINQNFSGIFVKHAIDASKFPIVCCVVDSLKAHKVPKLESDHCNVENNYN